MTHPNIELMQPLLGGPPGGQAADALAVLCRGPRPPHPRAEPARRDVPRPGRRPRVLHPASSATPNGALEVLGVDDILASDDHAVTLVRWRLRRGDRTLDVDRVVVYRIVDGRIAEIWVRDWDQYAYDEFFADAEHEEDR